MRARMGHGLNHARHCMADTILLAPRPSPGRQLRHCVESYARAAAVPIPVWCPYPLPLDRGPINNGHPLSPNGCHSDASHKPTHTALTCLTPQASTSSQPAPYPTPFLTMVRTASPLLAATFFLATTLPTLSAQKV
jgi:hypothetical protein